MTSDKNLALHAAYDPTAFGELFDRYALRIYRYCYSRVQHHESAEDITAQVFQDALEHIDQYRPIGPFAAWLFTIARRRVADHYRALRPTEELSEESSQSNPEILAGVIRQEDLQRLESVLQKLDENDLELKPLRGMQRHQRHARRRVLRLGVHDEGDVLEEGRQGVELLRLRFAAEMRYKEIAALVNKTPGAVKTATYRLLNRLKADMEKIDDPQ